jgi:hypothetical protein
MHRIRMKSSRLTLLLCAAAAFASNALEAQSITLSPGYTSIGVNQTLQYTAIVTGLANTSLTWKVSNVTGGNSTWGTIAPTGAFTALYTAPATIPSGGITVSALGSDNKTMGIVYVNVAQTGPAIMSISPSPIPTGNYTITLTAPAGTSYQRGAVVSFQGNNNLPTTWIGASAIKASGWNNTVGPATFYVMNPGSLWGPGFTASFVQSGPPPPQTISPTTVSVNLGATQQFSGPNATSWTATLNGSTTGAGAVTSSGLYTAPSTMPSSNTVKVTATGPGGSASATVTLVNPNAPAIAPSVITLNLSATQTFVSSGATTWTATYGTVDSSGNYTAPSVYPASGTDTVTATGPNGSASATVTLNPPTPAITSVGANNQLPLGVFSTTVGGTGFTNKSAAVLGTLALNVTGFTATTLSVTGFASTSGVVNLVVSNGAAASQPFAVQVGVPNAVVSAAAARRFLEQAAFGPTPNDASHVQAIGFQAWINEQLGMPVISNYSAVTGSQGGLPAAFLANAVTNADQLRQRVAFALSQIFVTSITKLIWNGDVAPYQQMLINDAFTNYRRILGDVTLSAGMGEYLDMANNAKASPAAGTAANENYAREVMQLFSIGDVLLNQDGAAQVDSTGAPIPAYLQPTVAELARVFTGWTYTPVQPGGQPVWGAYINSAGPMVNYDPMHDFGSKTLLTGYAAPANLSTQADLQAALDNIASHPNVAPFISRQLIQHLVKSNPTPAYVQRVAQAFTNSNGNMPATITAILLDAEARANDEGGNDQPTDGHLQEPALFIAGFVRAFNGQMTTANYYASDLAALGEDIYNPPSVFNYFSPGYTVAGTGGLKGPEFQIDNPNAAILRENLVASFFSQYSNPVQSYGPGTTVDLTSFRPLAGTPATLVAALDLTLTHGAMPAAMKQVIVNAVTADTLGSLHQVQTACYLILTSSYYNVWH